MATFREIYLRPIASWQMERLRSSVIFVVACWLFASHLSAYSPGDFLASVKTKEKVLALSFDDGPGKYTNEILEVLEQKNIKATFFVQGSKVKIYPEILKKTHLAGHEIANHTYSHINFHTYKKPDYRQKLIQEIEKTEKAVNANIYARTGLSRLLRMPHGYIRWWVREVAKEKGYIVVNWSFGYDWHKKGVKETAQRYIQNMRPGAIFLFHDGGRSRTKTVEVLKKVLEAAEKNSYKIVTVGELINLGR